jgi:uncharacterized protein (TIGR02217 family)
VAEPPPFLASRTDQVRQGWVKRFRPNLWTTDFPRPVMAAVHVPAPDLLRMDLDFLTRADLVGLIWASEDRWSHPLLAYATDRDYRGCTLGFEWAAGPGVMPLDAVNGAVLTVEGRDAAGLARTWYVRLWNYAVGTPMLARVQLNMGALRAGFGTDGEPVYMGDVDRMFVSIVPAGFDGTSTPLAAVLQTHVEFRNWTVRGPRSTLKVGDAFLPEHGMRMCSGYDDSYNQAPERLVEQWEALGYRALVNHYVGMSHYYALQAAGSGRFEVSGGLCASAVAWHRALLRAANAAGFELILSLSFELFDANAPAEWAQRDVGGNRALTGWEPPSTLLSPCNSQAMGWLQGIASAFGTLAAAEAQRVLFQVGEPWWWVGPEGRPCFYDAATVDRWVAETGSQPPPMGDVLGVRSSPERAWMDWLGARLSDATLAVRDAAAEGHANRFVSHLLFYAPQVLASDTPDLRRANMPSGWVWPAWDVLQLEDYGFVTAGDEGGMARARAAADAALGYPIADQHYLSGFVLQPSGAAREWPLVAAAAKGAVNRGVSEVFFWAWPQMARDGFTWVSIRSANGTGEDAMQAFHDVRFPLELGFDAVGGPEFATQVALLASGHEQRNVQWAQARLSYDAGLGVRSEADLMELLAFFRARRGRGFGFRLRDPLDFSSSPTGGDPAADDQLLGIGDGLALRFPLVKRYGFAGAEEVRRITRPEPGSVVVSLDGDTVGGWLLGSGGTIELAEPPAAGVEVRAGFLFDVPVRFAADRLDVSLSGVRSGEAPSVPLVEIRE